MREETGKQYYRGLRRFLADLRLAVDRRGFDDRRNVSGDPLPSSVAFERRSGQDRRIVNDRRWGHSAPYSPGDTLLIHEMLMNPRLEVACPQCDGYLMLGPPMSNDGDKVRRVHCTSCRRNVTVPDLPQLPDDEKW